MAVRGYCLCSLFSFVSIPAHGGPATSLLMPLPPAFPLCRKLPEVQAFPSVNINLQYLNGDDKLRDQAAYFWNASLLIWPHGATMAMTTFLPRVRRSGGFC
jgi:hypothetical protein